MNIIFYLLIILLLSSCAGAPVGWGGKYEVIQSNSESITIKYDTVLGANSIFEPANVHCAKHGKEPVPTSKTIQSLGIALQTFVCK